MLLVLTTICKDNKHPLPKQHAHVYTNWSSVAASVCEGQHEQALCPSTSILNFKTYNAEGFLSPPLRAPRCCAFDFYFKILRLYVFFCVRVWACLIEYMYVYHIQAGAYRGVRFPGYL